MEEKDDTSLRLQGNFRCDELAARIQRGRYMTNASRNVTSPMPSAVASPCALRACCSIHAPPGWSGSRPMDRLGGAGGGGFRALDEGVLCLV